MKVDAQGLGKARRPSNSCLPLITSHTPRVTPVGRESDLVLRALLCCIWEGPLPTQHRKRSREADTSWEVSGYVVSFICLVGRLRLQVSL